MKKTDAASPPPGELAFGFFRSDRPFTTVRRSGTDGWLLLYTVAGHGRFRTAGKEIITGGGDAVLIRPGVPQNYGTVPESPFWQRLWSLFQPPAHWLEWLRWPEPEPGMMILSVQDPLVRSRIKEALLSAVEYSGGRLRRKNDFAMNALEQALLQLDTINPAAAPQIDFRINKALDYLSRNPAERITLSRLARYCGLSVSRFSVLFRSTVNKTPQQFHEILRLNRAQQLLRLTQHSVAEIGRETGYSDPFYFSSRFKRHTGLSPRGYRQQFGLDEPES